MNLTLPKHKDHPVNIEINGHSFSIDAGLSVDEVVFISSSKESDSKSIIADTIASKINKKYNTCLTKEQIVVEEDSILPVFLKRVPHFNDSLEGFQTTDELVNQAKEYIAKLSAMIKVKSPKMPDYASTTRPSPETIKTIGDSLRYEQERKLEEYEARESTKETAYNTAELLTAISEMKSETKKTNKNQHRINVLMVWIGFFTLFTTIAFGIINIHIGKQNAPLLSSQYENDSNSNFQNKEDNNNNVESSNGLEDISETIDD